jgi:hypothetical protein
MKKNAIICDLDGTLAIIGDRSPYDGSSCDKDKPNWPVILCVLAMYREKYDIIFMSGRYSKYRAPTEVFIKRWLPDVPYELFMRANGDNRKDAIVKQELYDANVRNQYNVLFVLDDRNQVVDFWRSIGLTCFQVAPGDF